MSTLSLPEPELTDSDIIALLEHYEPFLVILARKSIPQDLSHPDTLDLDIDELVQSVRIKLWQALRRRPIAHLPAYIRCIVRTEVVNMVRGRKPTYPLPVTDEGELYQGNVLMTFSEGMQDPSYEIEQKEAVAGHLIQTVNAVVNFPPVQQRAMICYLKDRLENIAQVVDAFRAHEITIEQEQWPEQKENLHSYRTSVIIARNKLHALLDAHEV